MSALTIKESKCSWLRKSFSADNANSSLCISMDDKAYLRPETFEGAKGAWQQTILQPSDRNQSYVYDMGLLKLL